MLHHRLYTLIALFHAFAPAAAQNSTFNSSNYERCSGGLDSYTPDGAVNSTGTIGFNFGDINPGTKETTPDWYLSVTLNETGRSGHTDGKSQPAISQWLSAWLSVPNDSSGPICIYKLRGVNATATDSGNNGCDGILGPDCIKALRDATNPAGLTNATTCPAFKETTDTKMYCGDKIVGSTDSDAITWTSSPIDLSNRTCTIPAPPQVSVPTDYSAYQAIGIGSSIGTDHDISSFTWYDTHVQQPIPFIVMQPFRPSNQSALGSQVICVAPNNVVKGSRTPQLPFPPKDSSAASWGATWHAVWRVVLIAGMAGFMLVV